MNGAVEQDDQRFNIETVIEALGRCDSADGHVYIHGFLTAFHELHKFLVAMGTVLTFVDTDVQQKVTLVECLRQGGAGQHYDSLQTMIEYERDAALIDAEHSGCRTLLCLHRAIEFIAALLRAVHDLPDGEKMAPAGRQLYRRTLGRHHVWLVHKAALLAMFALGSRRNMFDKLVGERVGGDEAEGQRLLMLCVDKMERVHSLMQVVFEQHNLS